MLTMQQNLKENGFKIIESMTNNTCHSSISYNFFRQAKNYVGQVKIINYFPDMVLS